MVNVNYTVLVICETTNQIINVTSKLKNYT